MWVHVYARAIAIMVQQGSLERTETPTGSEKGGNRDGIEPNGASDLHENPRSRLVSTEAFYRIPTYVRGLAEWGMCAARTAR